MKTLVIAGEHSGDRYGAELLKALKSQRPDLRCFGVGGDAIQAEVSFLLHKMGDKNIVGVGALVQRFSTHKSLYQKLKLFLEAQVIDFAVIVDFQHHNAHIAKILRAFNIPIYTYITPNFWLYKDRRQAKKVLSYSKKIITIFEKEYLFYKQFSPYVYYFGHPLPALKSNRKPANPFKGKGPKLGVFPGSREQELCFYLDKMLQVIKGVQKTVPALQVQLALTSDRFKSEIDSKINAYGLEKSVKFWTGKPSSLLHHSDTVLCASGSTTLEAILYKTPQVIFAALSPLTYFLAKHVLRIKMPYVALPNIIAGKEVAPEFVQEKMEIETMVQTTLTHLAHPENALARYDEVLTHIQTSDNPFTGAATEILTGL